MTVQPKTTTATKPSDRSRGPRPSSAAGAAGLNVVVLRGHIAAPPQAYEARDGSRIVAFDVVTVADAGRENTPVSWFDPPASADELDAGDHVVVVGRVRKRFVRVGASSRPFTDVVAHQVVRASRRRQVAQLLADAAARLGAQ